DGPGSAQRTAAEHPRQAVGADRLAAADVRRQADRGDPAHLQLGRAAAAGRCRELDGAPWRRSRADEYLPSLANAWSLHGPVRRRALLLRLRSAHPLPRQRSAALADHQQRREERIPAAPAGLVRSPQPLALRALVATQLVDQASAAGGGAAPARPQKRRRAAVERFGHRPAGARPQRPAAGDSSTERRWLSANGISRRELKAQACNRSAPPTICG